MRKFLFFYAISAIVFCANGAKILGLFNFPMKSHYILGRSLMEGLAVKGHQITMISPYQPKEINVNITDLSLPEMEIHKGIFQGYFKKDSKTSSLLSVFGIMDILETLTRTTLKSKSVQKLLSSNHEFDLIIIDWANNDALLGLAEHFKSHVILFVTFGANSFVCLSYKCIQPYSHIPGNFLNYTPEMTFPQRLYNGIYFTFNDLLLTSKYLTDEQKVLSQYFPKSKPLEQLMSEVSLIFFNTNPSVDYPKPLAANMIEVGGLHIKKPKTLPENLQNFLDGSKNGTIFFSLGSNIKSSDLPREKLQDLLKSFARLPYRILWKFERDLESVPENVLVQEWMPQNDILAHPNIRCFITQGGALSLSEATFYGVPIIGIPFFADQDYNVLKAVYMGTGLLLNFDDLNGDTLSGAIEEIMKNSTYRENMRKRSDIARDQILNPLDTAIFWTEYVLRHNGTSFLRTAAHKLHWYQYYMLDVIGFLSITFMVLIYFLISIVKKLLRYKNRKIKIE